MSPAERDEMAALVRELDPLVWEILGKSAWDATWDELQEVSHRIDSDYARAVHSADQANAELRERTRRGETS